MVTKARTGFRKVSCDLGHGGGCLWPENGQAPERALQTKKFGEIIQARCMRPLINERLTRDRPEVTGTRPGHTTDQAGFRAGLHKT